MTVVSVRPGATAQTVAEEAGMEAAVRHHEAQAHVANLRLLARQLPEQSARTLNRLADDYARKFEQSA